MCTCLDISQLGYTLSQLFEPRTPKKHAPKGVFLVYPLGFEPRLDGVGGRNVIQLHYEYVFVYATILLVFLLFCKRFHALFFPFYENFSLKNTFPCFFLLTVL